MLNILPAASKAKDDKAKEKTGEKKPGDKTEDKAKPTTKTTTKTGKSHCCKSVKMSNCLREIRCPMLFHHCFWVFFVLILLSTHVLIHNSLSKTSHKNFLGTCT